MLTSCSNEKNPNILGKEVRTSIILENLKVEEYPSVKMDDDNHFIYLGNDPDCVINGIDKITFCDQKPIILDKKQKALFVFDEAGRFISKIHDVGNGPNEYIQLNDFCISEQTKSIFALVVAGIHKSVVYEYGLDGKQKNRFKLPFIAYNIGTFDNCLVFFSNFSSSMKKDFNIHITTKECKVISKHFPYTRRSNLEWGYSSDVFIQYEDQLFYQPVFCDTIYHISDSQSVKPFILLKEKEVSDTHQHLDVYMNTSMDKFFEYSEKNPFRQFSNLIITEDSIFFSSDNQGMEESYIFHIKSNKLRLLRGGDYFSLLKASPLLVYENYLIAAIYPYEIHNFVNTIQKRVSSKGWEEFQSNNNCLIEIFENTTPNDNPVIIKFN